MTKVHKQATFQPTIRPSWAGAMSYIPVEEKAQILDALVKYPEIVEIDSIFWKETIKPDLDLQYNKFIATCEARKQVARTYWDNQKTTNGIQLHTKCISKDIQMVIKTKDKDKDKDKDKGKDKNKEKQSLLFNELINKYPNLEEPMYRWLKYKKEKKEPYTDVGLEDCFEKLQKLSGGDKELAMAIVKQSTSNTWSGLFPLKNQQQTKSKAQIIEEHNLKHIEELFGGV